MRISVLLSMLWMLGCTANQQSPVPATGDNPSFISLDSANKMIGSYLNSINYSVNDTDIRSFILDAGQLRKYLDSADSSGKIKYIKISMAHSLDYINSGNGNRYAGYKSNALTPIISGVDGNGNYVFFPSGLAINRAASCPSNCPPGTAGNDFLILSIDE